MIAIGAPTVTTARCTATARAQDGEDDERPDAARATAHPLVERAGVRKPGARPRRRAHARVGGADHPGLLRGLSVRDVEALLEEALGEQVVGKSTVARICQDTRERYRAWCQRRHPDPAVLRVAGTVAALGLTPSSSGSPTSCIRASGRCSAKNPRNGQRNGRQGAAVSTAAEVDVP